MPDTELEHLLAPLGSAETLICKITLGPLTIDTQASLEQVAALILALVKEYRELPVVTVPGSKLG